jgi:hypothetical protein
LLFLATVSETLHGTKLAQNGSSGWEYIPCNQVSIGLNNAFSFDAGWSSPVARQARNLKVTGSNPVPATKIDTKNLAISINCWFFVFEVEPSPQQNQWLSFVGSNHPQPVACCVTHKRSGRTAMMARSFVSARRVLRSAWPYFSD